MSHFMLAGKADDLDRIVFPVMASPKLDGVRGGIIEARAMSRNLKPFPNALLQGRYGRKLLEGLDGEFIYGNGTDPTAFRKTGSMVMSRDAGVDDIWFHVFDDWTYPKMEFRNRLSMAESRIEALKGEFNIALVQHTIIENVESLLIYEARAVEKGYEGVMLRSLTGPYKHGRSTEREGWLLKLKRFEDSEAVIDDVQEFQHNENERGDDGKRTSHKAGKRAGGKLGALIVRDIHTGVQFQVGSGFNERERQHLWSIRDELKGQVIKYKFFPTGSKDKPRFPTFEGFRHPIDCP